MADPRRPSLEEQGLGGHKISEKAISSRTGRDGEEDIGNGWWQVTRVQVEKSKKVVVVVVRTKTVGC